MVGEIPAVLINDFHKGKVVLFIGSGLSISGNLPGWVPLLNRLRGQLLGPGFSSRHFDALEPLQKAQFLYDNAGRKAVTEEIRRIFRQPMRQSELHSLLVSLPIQMFITTNWDRLIETSYYNVYEMPLTTIWRDDQISSARNPVLIKLHGTIEDPTSIIFSEDDYYRFSAADSLLGLYVKATVATSTILFVGYGFRDFDFKLMNTYVREKLAPQYGRAFIFLPNGDNEQRKYLEKRGITPIIYKKRSKKEATLAFLRDLCSEVSITTADPVERLLIINRENCAVRGRAKGMIIRNHSNFGPLATPNKPSDQSLFGTKKIGELEIRCAESWQELLRHGAKARCMVCLNSAWILEYFRRRGRSITLRLKTLQNNVRDYGNKVEIVDVGVPTNVNIDIYGQEVCLESKKSGFQLRPYTRLSVIRNDNEIKARIKDFDRAFMEILNHNRRQAQREFKQRTTSVNKYMIHKIDQILSSIDQR